MTLTELLASVRRVEVRTNRLVNASVDEARASARFTIRKPAASNPIIRLTSSRTLKRRERRAPVRSVPVCRNSNPIEFDGVGNCGEFAIIKSQADEPNRFFNSLEFDGIKKAYQPVNAQLSHEPTKKNRH